MLKILLSLAYLIIVISLIASIVLIRRQRTKEMDKGVNPTSVKHYFIANPMMIAYVLFPIVLAIGAAIWMYYFY
ncbi:hypothetical protein P9314_08965 [Paenibacillus validus]|uniref:Short-chain dehydrogenase n=1 Tax=Paenibacillus validus TaxID=44253 RepID=A0A7X2Z8L8_9BACL|nr:MULTISPECIES: hypothetical protein [Paenibacillus]MED4600834.1 hypothetical protein [Paenibacillus validus]MED4606606.1 hypothetical protein [Paenibacillus validus]MUG70338.1 hypothetical protein [Paenibacillus validus]